VEDLRDPPFILVIGVHLVECGYKRFATPEELAHFFVFLCSDKASYCVGSTYYVDGGWLNATA
jgi:NAD(P)-dependent dehydrogenase (short-subunit alcohol dehydrogenase family)